MLYNLDDEFMRVCHLTQSINYSIGDEGQDQKNFYASFGLSDLRQILQADDLCVDSEESVYDCVQQWINFNAG